MDLGGWLSVVGGVISIIAFVFSVWVWLRADIKVRELKETLQAASDISASILWEMHTADFESREVRLEQAERSLGLVSALHILTSKYSERAPLMSGTEFGALIQRGVIWTQQMINSIEVARDTREVWLLTPDFEPDATGEVTGSLVHKNLESGKRYVYFYPSNLSNVDEIIKRLCANTGTSKSRRLRSRIKLVPVDERSQPGLFHRGNSILFFKGDPSESGATAFEEIVLTRVLARGLFWQEHSEAVGEELRRTLWRQLKGAED